MESLAALFLAALPEGVRAAEVTPELEGGLRDAWERGCRAHPDVRLDATTFARALGERRRDREFSWRETSADDFFLAVACLEGDKAALRTFESSVMKVLARKLGAGQHDRALVDATIRNVREAMFVGTERRKPKLAVYTGQVPLAAWILVVGRRELASEARKKTPEVSIGTAEAFEAHVAPADPELVTLLRAHRGTFEQAITNVMAGLDRDDRDLLRWNMKEGASIDTIAPRLGVNRATVARRLARLREKLADEVRTELRRKLRLGSETFDSLCANMMPELDVSLSRIL
jgi:RNA polymerase sigma-70 factor, ECF subfamily